MCHYRVNYAAALLLMLWNLSSMKKLVASLCEEAEVHINGPANVELTLTCNTSHLLSNVQIVTEFNTLLYSYFLGVNCLDVNGSLGVSLDIWNNVYSFDGNFHLVHTPTLHPGFECVLFGCYKFTPEQRTYAFNPSVCIVDENECLMQTHNCNSFANCTNTVGSYECSCWYGYDGDGLNCNDTDECGSGGHDCSEYAHCTNTPGGYSCVCLNGYDGDGVNCTDEDECLMQTHNCSDWADCRNTVGSYECYCRHGYHGDGFNCNDTDECGSGGHDCNEYAHCTNIPGGYNCVCLNGYDGDGVNCTDEDECLMQTHNCSDWADCRNTVGSYNCSCWYGFDGDGFDCNDINECGSGVHDCSEYAQCTNIHGGYNCSCPSGYDVDGVNCTGIDTIDECSLGTANCSLHARCIDTEDGYLCVCMDTYEGNGFSCSAGSHHMNVATFWAAPLSLVLLCLGVSLAAMIIYVLNTQKKRSWIQHLEEKWVEQEVDKDYTPVDLTFAVSSSLQSVIEPLQLECKEFCTRDLTGQSNSCGESDEDSTCSTTTKTARMKYDQDEDTCCIKADQSLESQNCTCDNSTKRRESTVHVCQCQTSVFQLEDVNALDSQGMKDESGFMSDTSSSVYLSFYKLSNKH